MKNFNRIITIEVSVDSIAQQMLAQINPEFKHREMLVETIFGRALSEDESAISKIYNALNGHTQELNFKVGDKIAPKDVEAWGYWTAESIEKNNTVRGKITTATVKEINIHANRQILLEFEVPQKNGTVKMQNEWVYAYQCEKIAE